MKLRFASVVPLSALLAAFTFAGFAPANAQNQPATAHLQPPPILVVHTEFLKPGESAAAHVKTEAAIAQTLRNANAGGHYLGLIAITGRARTVFVSGCTSFADCQAQHDSIAKNASLQDQLRSQGADDAALLGMSTRSIYRFDKDLSLNPGAADGTRFFELTLFHVRPGHEKDWRNVVKMYQDAYAKIPGAHWDMFEKLYGEHSGGTWLLAVPMKSLAEEDDSMANSAKLKDIVGAEQLQKMQDLGNATIESVESNLFAISPKMSYEWADWTKADPKFFERQGGGE